MCFVTVDRPGYGLSTRLPGRAVADFVDDLVTVADAMGWGRFAVTGGSGGDPHALACAARLPDRVARVICDVGIAPWGAAGLDYFDGMVEGNVTEFTTAMKGEPELRALLEPEAADTVERMKGDMRDFLGPSYPARGMPAAGCRLAD